MKYFSKTFLAVFITISCIFPLSSFATFSFEVGTGVVYNIPMPLVVKQNGQPDIKLTARYETKPFRPPFYYMYRIGYWKNMKSWELEFIHHKIYLQNTNSEIRNFSISHGYNLIYLNRAWTISKLILRGGVGFVIAHPESTVRGLGFNERGGTLNNSGYYVTGPAIQISLGKRFYYKKVFLGLEGKLTAAYADVKVAQGHAIAPNIALHGDFTLGFDLF